MGQESEPNSRKLILVGALGAPFGVRGWLKINSYTEPKSNIWKFEDWWIVPARWRGQQEQENHLNYSHVYRAKESRDRFLVLFQGVSTRTDASKLTNYKILIERESLPELSENEYYWVDLIGSKIYSLDNNFIGILDYAFHNGANDVMLVKGDKQYLIPYILGEVVIKVDVAHKTIIIKWDLD